MNCTSTAHATGDGAAGFALPIRVLLADDHSVTLWGLRQLVESAHPQYRVSGTANSCASLLAHTELEQTDVVLLDLSMGDGNAVNYLEKLVCEHNVKVVLLTGDLNPAHHRIAVMRGARGVVLKSEPTQHILDAIGRVHRGEVSFGRALTNLLLTSMPGLPRTQATTGGDAAQRAHSLTPKELLVVQALVRHRGAKSLVVADALGMSEHTLRNHLTAIYDKLGVQRKLDLYVYAIEHRLGAEPLVNRRRPAPSGLWGGADSAWGAMS